MAAAFKCDLTKLTPTVLSFGVPSVDAIFGSLGGIPAQGITEFYGASGSGKTQLALHLTVCCLTQNADNKVVYICTEGVFPMKRFSQLVSNWEKEGGVGEGSRGNRLLLRHEATIETLMQCITIRLPTLLQSDCAVRCVVIDSIAAVFRCESKDELSHVERSQIFFKLASCLKHLSSLHNLHVIVTNQVSDIFPEDILNVHHWLTGNKKPSLGLSWSNCVTCRVLVSSTQYSMPVEVKGHSGQVPLRRLDVVMSCFCARKSCFFVIDDAGVQPVH